MSIRAYLYIFLSLHNSKGSIDSIYGLVMLDIFFKYEQKWKLEETEQTNTRLLFYHEVSCFLLKP